METSEILVHGKDLCLGHLKTDSLATRNVVTIEVIFLYSFSNLFSLDSFQFCVSGRVVISRVKQRLVHMVNKN